MNNVAGNEIVELNKCREWVELEVETTSQKTFYNFSLQVPTDRARPRTGKQASSSRSADSITD